MADGSYLNLPYLRDAMADGYACMEMRKKQSWSHSLDYFALGASVHALLHAQQEGPMLLESDGGRWRPKAQLPQGATGQVWNQFFDVMLNSPPSGEQHNLSALADDLHKFLDESPKQRALLKQAIVRSCVVLTA